MPRESEVGVGRGSAVYPVRLPADLKDAWAAHCLKKGKSQQELLRALMRYIILDDMPPEVQQFIQRQTKPAPDKEPKIRFEILLTQSEMAALADRANVERCSRRRWIVDAIRAGLTSEPQFGMREIEALGESNYQLLALGRNLNQIARKLNEGNYEPVTVERIAALSSLVSKHTDVVNTAIRSSLERWNIE